MKNCLLKHLIIISCVFLVMHVGLIYVLIIPTNFNHAPLNVSSLVTVYFIRDINAYISPLAVSIFPEMCSSTKIFFLLLGLVL